ncbi:MAG: polyprenyl synthetase family protein [Anaerolineae bacterium]|nr:polyprenyl synthetase family protein [Phycisphaerae bacterium]
MNLLGSDQLARIELHLRGVLSRTLCAEGLSGVNQVIREYVLAGGKRIRPQLCLWTHRQASGSESDSAALLDLACVWELFHAFLLAHDDIIDASDVRRDQPSLHRRMESLDGHSRKFGTNLAIVGGDLLFSAAMRLLHELDVSPQMHRDQLRIFSRVACTTGFGQAIDICQSHAPIADVPEELLLREYHWKTASYTFEGPMLSGAMLAGVEGEGQCQVARFALALGQAYQLQNDLTDLANDVHEGCDIVQGKRTVTMIRARAAMDDATRAGFDQKLTDLKNANGHTTALAQAIRVDLRRAGAVDRTRELIACLLETAQDAAKCDALPMSLRAGMFHLLAALRSTYFASG